MTPSALDLSEWERRDRAEHEAAAALLQRVHDKTPELQAILRRHRVAEAFLFGSVARHEPRRGSDVDIAVLHCPPETFYRLASELERALGISLDLVSLDHAPADFLSHVRETGQRLYP